jgi:cell division septation protein DedD
VGDAKYDKPFSDDDGESRIPRGVTLLFVAFGGACIVFAGFALGGRRSSAIAQAVDSRGDPIAREARETRESRTDRSTTLKSTDLSAHDVTFPGILSDDGSPTTALAAVKGGSKSISTPTPSSSAASVSRPVALAPPQVPLPAQHVLDASPVVTRPRDSLTRAANDAAQITSPAEPAAPRGRAGGYQLQVSSFRTLAEADKFALQLRARGHKAYVTEVHVADRGTWYRVRIGPFASQLTASAYRSSFEEREHVVPFVVPPASK